MPVERVVVDVARFSKRGFARIASDLPGVFSVRMRSVSVDERPSFVAVSGRMEVGCSMAVRVCRFPDRSVRVGVKTVPAGVLMLDEPGRGAGEEQRRRNGDD